MESRTVTRRPRIRWGLQFINFVFASLALFAFLTYSWFVEPTDNRPDHADAVFVFAGGRGERLQTGIQLMEDGIADHLLINMGTDFDSRAGSVVKEFCDNRPASMDVICIEAYPDSTEGEAESFSRVAEAQGWKSVVVVSTDHHLRRATLWTDRCFSGAVYSVQGDAPTSKKQVEHEWLGMLAGLLVDRDC